MLNTIIGTKSHMEQQFTLAGHRVPVTVVKASGNLITQIKTTDKDGYSAIQLGIGIRKAKNTSKPQQGHLKKSQKSESKIQNYPRNLKEVRLEDGLDYVVGSTISTQDVLKPGDKVKVTGISKGKGFAGVVKRWGFAGGPKTHGQSDRHRAPGSIGQGTTPGRVLKGKKMAGRMGSDQVTVKNLTVLKIEKNGDIWLSGPVPGNKGGLLIIEKIGDTKDFQQLYSKDIPEEVVLEAMEEAAEAEAANRPVVEGESEEGAENTEEAKGEAKE